LLALAAPQRKTKPLAQKKLLLELREEFPGSPLFAAGTRKQWAARFLPQMHP